MTTTTPLRFVGRLTGIVASAAVIGWMGVLCLLCMLPTDTSCVAPTTGTLAMPTPENTSTPYEPRFSRGPGYSIQWEQEAGVPANTAQPVAVLREVANRLSYLQQTPSQSDKQARALFSIMEAVDVLQDSKDVSSPVGPGLPIPPEGE